MCSGYLEFYEYQMLGGACDITAFPRLEYRARKLIDKYTQKRVSRMREVPESVKRCMVEIIYSMASADPVQTAVKPALSGFSNDGYSESYASPVTAESLDATYYRTIFDYLSSEYDDDGTPLLYCGVDA